MRRLTESAPGEDFSARARPPFKPHRRPNAPAAGFISDHDLTGSENGIPLAGPLLSRRSELARVGGSFHLGLPFRNAQRVG